MTPDKLSHPCRRDYYPAAHNSGKRPLSAIKLIVMHDTEGGTAAGVANYFTSQASGGSAHLVVDNNRCYRCLEADMIPWGAANANLDGFHIEQCGYASWSKTVWRVKNLRMLRRAAYKAAGHCITFGIPPVFVHADGLALGRSGITTHAEVSKWGAAFRLAGDHSHTDPGPNWPRRLFMFLVRRYHSRLLEQRRGAKR